jgi:hypothetical protein
MDDRAFLAELEHWEAASVRTEPAHVRNRPYDDLETGLPASQSETQPPATPPLLAPLELDDNTRGDQDDRIGWLVGGFLLLMASGAAGAALVFHHRVVTILALLR